MKRSLPVLLLLPFLFTLFIAPVFALEIPYSHDNPATGMACSTYAYDDVNPVGGYALLAGESSSDWDGQTLTLIEMQLCALNPNPSSTNLMQIGVFTPSGSVQHIFGTFSYGDLPAQGCCTQDWISVTVTGSYVMQSTDIIGLEFTDANLNYAVAFMCQSPCAGTETTATLHDIYPPDFSVTGKAFAGTFQFGSVPPPPPPGPTPSGQASAVVGVLMVLIIIALAVALFEQPELPTVIIKTAITAIVVLGIIFVVFSAVGL